MGDGLIGIFDSGFGGLTIFREIEARIPEYSYVYLGDSARTPYGNRSKETVFLYTSQAVSFLFERGCELIITACSTASSLALRRIQQELLPATHPERRVLGMVHPCVEEAQRVTKIKRVGVVGTRGTVSSGSFPAEIEKLDPKIKVFQQACPLLVPLIEEGWEGKPETKTVLRKYLRPLKSKNVDVLILGCTHYPVLLEDFERNMGKNCKVVHPGKATAFALEDYLLRHPEMETRLSRKPKREFFTTDDRARFEELGSRFFGRRLTDVEKVDLFYLESAVRAASEA